VLKRRRRRLPGHPPGPIAPPRFCSAMLLFACVPSIVSVSVPVAVNVMFSIPWNATSSVAGHR